MISYWLSFASDSGFLGAILVDVPPDATIGDALFKVNLAGINPGGQVAGFIFDTEDDRLLPHERESSRRLPRLKLLSRKEIESCGTEGKTLAEAKASGIDMDRVEDHLDVVCEDCNPKKEAR